ncbi:hypothetical protein I4U23_003764 [Adineta vaga]|nr:hypothetical protein I4U23_003764 [Adineta vaga]
MRSSNRYDANEYHTEIVNGTFDDFQPRPVRSQPQPIRTIAYDREYQYEDKGSNRSYPTNPPKNSSKYCTKRCLIGFGIGLLLGILILIAVVVPVAVLTRCSLGTTASTANWVGTFRMDGSCDTTTCCCSVSGVCSNLISTVSLTQTMPTGFQTYFTWSGETIRARLGQDNSYISLVNILHGTCSTNGLRTSYNGGSMINMNLYLIVFISLITMGKIM